MVPNLWLFEECKAVLQTLSIKNWASRKLKVVLPQQSRQGPDAGKELSQRETELRLLKSK